MSLKLLQKKLRENFPIYGSFIYGSTWYMHYSRGTKPENCNQYNTESSPTSRCQQLNFNTQMHDHSFSLSGPR